LAESYLSEASSHAGIVAEGAANREEFKYQSLATTHTFIPLAFGILGPINSKGVAFFSQLGGRLTACTGDMRETSFMFQHLSLTVQRFNAICFQGSLHSNLADFDSCPLSAFVFKIFVFSPRDLYYRGHKKIII
jgi:hypothetical protein